MSNQVGAPPAQTGGRNNTLIIIVVAVLVLCCCCILVSLPVLWSCGDMLMGTATECAPLF